MSRYQKIQEGVIETFRRTELAKDKDLILVVGNTGAGKSTTINYMLGHGLEEDEKNGGLKIALKNPSQKKDPAAMGDLPESVTMFPEAYHDDVHKIEYCDCPGYEDTGGKERQVVVSIGIEAVVHKSHSIPAVVVIIDWATIHVDRGIHMRKVASTLGNLFDAEKIAQRQQSKDKSWKLENSLLFVITKAYTPLGRPITHEYCMKKIADLLVAEGKRLQEEQSKDSAEALLKKAPPERKITEVGKASAPSQEREKQKVEAEGSEQETARDLMKKIAILNLMKNHPENIIMANVLDDGTTRKQILGRLQEMKKGDPIPKDVLDFRESDIARKEFCLEVTREMVEAKHLMTQVKDLPTEAKQIEQELAQLKSQQQKYQNQLQDIASGRTFLGEKDPIVIEDREAIRKNNTSIEEKKKEAKELYNTLEQKQRDLAGLDTTDEIEFYNSTFEGNHRDKIGDTVFAPVTAMSAAADKDGISGVAATLAILPTAAVNLATSPVLAIAGAFRRRDTNFYYNGAPFIRVEKLCASGEIEDMVNEPENGKYEGHYESGRVSTAKATIRIIGQKRNKPDNKIKIDELKKEIEILQSKVKDLKASTHYLSENSKQLEQHAQEFINKSILDLEKIKFKTEQLMKETKQQEAVLGEMLAAKHKELEGYQAIIGKKQSFWKIIQEMCTFIDFNTARHPTLVQQFNHCLIEMQGGVVGARSIQKDAKSSTSQVQSTKSETSGSSFSMNPFRMKFYTQFFASSSQQNEGGAEFSKS